MRFPDIAYLWSSASSSCSMHFSARSSSILYPEVFPAAISPLADSMYPRAISYVIAIMPVRFACVILLVYSCFFSGVIFCSPLLKQLQCLLRELICLCQHGCTCLCQHLQIRIFCHFLSHICITEP